MSVIHLCQVESGGKYISYNCPGCGATHTLRIKGIRPVWDWNGDSVKPTIRPSVSVKVHFPHRNEVCHHSISDGKIQFFGDCTHVLRGRTVNLPVWKKSLIRFEDEQETKQD